MCTRTMEWMNWRWTPNRRRRKTHKIVHYFRNKIVHNFHDHSIYFINMFTLIAKINVTVTVCCVFLSGWQVPFSTSSYIRTLFLFFFRVLETNSLFLQPHNLPVHKLLHLMMMDFFFSRSFSCCATKFLSTSYWPCKWM